MGKSITIGIIGDFNTNSFLHIATNQAIQHAATHLALKVKAAWLPTPSFMTSTVQDIIDKYDGLIASPGSPYQSMDGAIKGIQTAREMNFPFIGTWGGFQHTLLEYARNVAGLVDAGHTEIEPDTKTPLLVLASCPVDTKIVGGTRLSGKLKLSISLDSLAYQIYQKKNVAESFQCNYELNPEYRAKLESHGLVVSGISDNGRARIIELPDKRFFIATGFLPQLNSKPDKPHPLFIAFLRAMSE